ncbi:MAG: hypothetical protein M1826_001897 [Phylliscum demangeonii]|nr:MAG: hypothetical protein M1826_001897 [Phylliscum demangeonii]
MNLLMIAPLCDSRGQVRYHIGAQVDVSGIVKECTDLESLRRLVNRDEGVPGLGRDGDADGDASRSDEFQDLCEMFNLQELDTVRRWGGRMHKDMREDDGGGGGGHGGLGHRPRLLLSERSPDAGPMPRQRLQTARFSGTLSGVYQHYLLVRPYPSLRILFASPSLRVPGILQSPFLNKIGGSARVREELSQAMIDGRGVTAKVRWLTRVDDEGRSRWIHCTPLLGHNAQLGVWMVVVVDDASEKDNARRWRQAPPVETRPSRMRAGETHGGYAGPVEPSGRVQVSASAPAAAPLHLPGQPAYQPPYPAPYPATYPPEPHHHPLQQHPPPPPSLQQPFVRSPGVRTYHHPASLASSLSLDLDRPPSPGPT